MSYVTCERPLGRMSEIGIDSVKGDPALGFPLAAISHTAHLTGKPDARKAAPWCCSGFSRTFIVAKTGFDKNFDGTS